MKRKLGIPTSLLVVVLCIALGVPFTLATIPMPDVNRDGEVDILDLVIVGKHFGEEYPSTVSDCAGEIARLNEVINSYMLQPALSDPKGIVDVIGFRYKVTEKTTRYWYYSWLATVRNKSSSTATVFCYVYFLDSGGFLLDSGIEMADVLAGETKTLATISMLSVNHVEQLAAVLVGEITAYPE